MNSIEQCAAQLQHFPTFGWDARQRMKKACPVSVKVDGFADIPEEPDLPLEEPPFRKGGRNFSIRSLP